MGPDKRQDLGFWKPIPEWYIAFTDFGRNVWYSKFLQKGFRHCSAFAADRESGMWIVLDPMLDGAYVRTFTNAQMKHWINGLKVGGKATILLAKCQAKPVKRPRALLTCVSIISHLLGTKTCAVTPKQLYAHLLSTGASEVFRGKHG